MAETVTLVCPTCQEARYRSIRPLDRKDPVTAGDFMSIGDAPPPVDGQPAMCHVCTAMLTPMRSDKLQPRAERSIDEMKAEARRQMHEIAASGRNGGDPVGVKVLFSLEGDEKMLNSERIGHKLVMSTTKRVVVIDLMELAG